LSMATSKQKAHAKQIFQATLDGFRKATQTAPAAQKPRIDMLCQNWQSVIDDGSAIEKLSDIKDFEALVGYQREFNTNKLTIEQYIGKEMQRSAEIDLAVHITRNHRGAPITKLVETGQHKMPDFAAGTDGDSLFESKFLENYSPNNVKAKAVEGLNQIKAYVDAKGFTDAWGKVHIFTYDAMQGYEPPKVQQHIEQLVCQLKANYSFPFEVAFQVYGRAYYDWPTHNCR